MNETNGILDQSGINDLPDKVKQFEMNYIKNHPGSKTCPHNIYHIISEDRNGNIVNESFGINLLTDLGFSKMYTVNIDYTDRIYRIYVGNGVFDTLDHTSSELVSPISATSAIQTKSSASAVHTKYISDLYSNEVVFYLCAGYYDYTVWDEDKTVTEIGVTLGTTNNKYLSFHAAVYDEEGHKSSFVKRVNEKLTINVYAKAYIPIEKIVNNSWNQGISCVINSSTMFQQYPSDIWDLAYIRYISYDRDVFEEHDNYVRRANSGTITDNVYTVNQPDNLSFLLSDIHAYVSEIFVSTRVDQSSAYISYNMCNSYFIFLKRLKSENPIPFRKEFYKVQSYNSSSLMYTYGYNSRDYAKDRFGQLPMTNIHISSLRMYNGQTDEWDIDVPYLEPISYLDTSFGHLRYSVRENNWISFRNDYLDYRVFINEAPEYPIKQIENSNNRVFYVSDKYWDSTTWQIIPDVNNISRELGSKRFFMMFENSFDESSDDIWITPYGRGAYTRHVLRYDYEDNAPKLNLNNGSDEDYVDFGTRTRYLYSDYEYSGKCVQNDELGYIAQDGFLIYPDSVNPNPSLPNFSEGTYSGNISGIPYIHAIGGIELPDNVIQLSGSGYDGTKPGLIWNTTRGTHIANCGCNSLLKGVRVYTITNDPTVEPTYIDFTYDTPFSVMPGMSHSDNGYLVAGWLEGANNTNCTYVIEYDVEGVTPNMYKVEGYHHAFAIDLTNLFVAIDASVTDHLHMVIYDMRNREIYREFDLPEGYTFQGIAGWGDIIYVRVLKNDVYSTFVYRIQSEMIEETILNISMMIWDKDSWESHVQRAVPGNGNIESCMVLLASYRNPYAEYHLVFKESDPLNPIEIIRRENYETSSYINWQKAQLRYVNGGKQLLLTYTGKRGISIDLSWVLNHGTITTHTSWGDIYYNGSASDSPIYHNGYIYTLLMHKRYGNTFYCRFRRHPYQLWMDLCIEGSTYTPNALMNPCRLEGENIININYQVTNIGVNEPDPYVPPEP
jgi:hypothetical protein